MIRLAPFLAVFALALLAGCNQDPSPAAQGDDARRAEGEVLGGTISDAMLPLDKVKSESPPLREQPKEDASASPSGTEADRSIDDAGEAPADGADDVPAPPAQTEAADPAE